MGRGVKFFSGIALMAAVVAGCATIRQWMSDRQTSPADKVMHQEPAPIKPATAVDRPVRYSEEKTVIKESWKPEESAEQLAEKFTGKLLDIARTKIGCRYVYAAKGPNTFDCSGFTSYVYGSMGVSLSSSSSLQAQQGRRLGKDEALRPGDLVFFSGRSISKTVGHVGIVVEQDPQTKVFTFIHAAITAGVELQKSSQEYYAPRYLYASRVLPDVELKKEDSDGSELMRTFYEVAEGYSGHTLGRSILDGMLTEYQKLYAERFPAKPSPSADDFQPSDEYYVIKSGDTLSKVASRYHTSVRKLCELNGISEKSILRIGQKLRLK